MSCLNLNKYRTGIQALGRVEGILEHTIFKVEYPRLLNYKRYIVYKNRS